MNKLDERLDKLQKALTQAEEAKDDVKIAYCALDLGLYLLSDSKLPAAEEQFARIIKMAKPEKTNDELQKVLGEAYLIRGNILMGKSLYSQAVYLLDLAIALFSKFKNYNRLASAHRVLSKAYMSLGDTPKAEEAEKMAKFYSGKEEC